MNVFFTTPSIEDPGSTACNSKMCNKNNKTWHLSQSRVEGGQREQLPRALRFKGAPRDEIYLFQIK